MEKKERRKFSKEFKSRAIEMCESHPVSEVAESLGVTSSLLYKWKTALASGGAEAFRGNGNRTAEEEELRRLRKQVADLREENEILKKASAYFARHQR